jgi:DNA-binding MarR family transcriptional regulator
MRAHELLLGHLLWETAARVQALGDAATAHTSLTRASIGLLDQIATNPGVTIAGMTRLLPKTQQAVSQLVSRLESLGLIERRLVQGRRVGLYLTSAGTRARAEGNAAEATFEAGLERAIGKARYERLCKALVEIRPVLDQLAEERREPQPASRVRSRRKRSRQS